MIKKIPDLNETLSFLNPYYTIVGVGSLVYFNSLFNGFVWDDKILILNQKAGVYPLSEILRNLFHDPQANYYRPLANLFYSLIHAFSGEMPFFYHLTQLIFHILSTILVFALFKIFFKPLVALILALIFLVHPINVESVVYIATLQQNISFFFGMLALLVVTKLAVNTKSILLTTLLVFFSLMAKESGALFIPIILAWAYLFKKASLGFISPIIGVVPVYILLRLLDGKLLMPQAIYVPIVNTTLLERLINIPGIILTYLKTFFYPAELVISQHWVVRSMNWRDFYLPLSIVLLAVVILIIVYNLSKKTGYSKPFSFLSIWFLSALIFHLNLIPLSMTVADRWFYLPLVGLLGMIGIFFKSLKFKLGLKFTLFCLSVLLIVLLSIRTFIRNQDWKDAITLYEHDLQYQKDDFNIHNSLGYELLLLNRNNEAKTYLLQSVQAAPLWWENWSNLGVVYERERNIPLALDAFAKSRTNNEQYAMAYINESLIRLHLVNPADAKKFLQEVALVKLPKNADLWIILYQAEYKLGDKKAAQEAARQAFIIFPTQNTQTLYNQILKEVHHDK